MNHIVLLLVMLLSLWLYFSQRYPYFVVAFFTLAGLMLAGGVSPHVALSGFSSPATITITSMFILSAGLVKTGALNGLTVKLVHSSRSGMTRALLILGLIVAMSSAFMNNTPVVMLMVPVVLAMSREHGYFASKLLIPMSFFAIFGGTFTLMGTSTNLLVDDVWRSGGGAGFAMFDFLPLGLVFFVVGGLYLMTLGRKLLPETQSFSSLLPEEKSSHFVTELVVTAKSKLVGQQLKSNMVNRKHLKVMEIIRGEEVFLGEACQDLVLERGDALIIEGTLQELTQFKSSAKTRLATVIEDRERVPIRTVQMKFVELVVPPDAIFIGKRLRGLGLNRKFGVKVIAIQRRGRQHNYDLRLFRIKAGDVLLVQATQEDLERVKKSGDFLVVDHRIQNIQRTHKAKLAVAIMALVVLTAVLTHLPLVSLALAGAALMILTRCLTVEEALSAIDINVFFLLVGTIPLGASLVEAGMMEDLIAVMLKTGGTLPPVLLISFLYLMTNLATSVLSNNSVAVLFSPLAVGLAAHLSLSPEPFLMAVAFGASACFISPIGYQTNLIVMGPGGYRFRDYFKVGIPLTLILWALSTWLIPVFWPF